VIDDTEKKRSKSAKHLASLHQLREKDSGGCLLGQSLVFLLFGTPKITIPLGLTFDVPAPELTAWYTQERRLQEQGIPRQHRSPTPPPHPPYPTTQALALGVLQPCNAQPPDLTVQCIVADALSGTAAFVEEASTIFAGVQVIRQLRRHQQVRADERESPVAEYLATHPGTPQQRRSRGGEEVVASVGSARWYVSAHRTKRFIMALKYEGEDPYRYLMASDRSWRTLEMVQAHPLRWLVEVFVPDWKADEGWGTLTKQPGEEGSRRSVSLSLLVDHCRFLPPDQHAQLKDNLPAHTVGSLRAQVRGECLVTVIQELVAAEDPHAQLPRFTHTLHDVFAFAHSTKHVAPRQLGRLESTPSLKYRADDVMQRLPVVST
jgi:hypothetical protein